MNKHIPRVLQPGSVWYCFVLLAFTAAAALLDQYYLAGAELVVTIAVFIISRVRFIRRKHILMDYVQSATDALGISVHAGTPFPMAVVSGSLMTSAPPSPIEKFFVSWKE